MGYWNNICEMQKKQTEKGVRTYGQTLEENTSMTDIERLEYLEEELIDGLMYIEHLKVKLNNYNSIKNELNAEIEHLSNQSGYNNDIDLVIDGLERAIMIVEEVENNA